MKRFATFLAVCILPLFAEEIPLPEDESVKMGKLPNGLTYYIQENRYPKESASLRLVVKAGSFYEEEEERGLAHFLEHMLFRGSKHFQDWEMVDYLESIGAKFGPDANAFTSFDLTCYMLDIPLEREEVLDKGILILSDWAGRANLENDKINSEREVIMDEYNRSTKSPTARVMNKYLDHFFHGSLYAERLPIGKKEVIRSCDPELIRKFYRKWYRPDRMAVIAVGDFDANVVESYIKEHFYDLSAKAETVSEPDLHYTAPEKSYFVIEEPEYNKNIGGLTFVEEIGESRVATQDDLRSALLSQIYESILQRRLNRASLKNPAPYLQASTSSFEISTYHRINELLFFCFENRPLDGLKKFYEMVSVLKEFGPSEEEWNWALDQIGEEIEERKANLDRIDHSLLVDHCINHFMQNVKNIPIDVLLDAKERLLSQVTPIDLAEWAGKSVDISRYHAIYITPKKDLVAKDRIEDCIKALEQQEWMKPVIEEKKKEFAPLTVVGGPSKIKTIFHPTDLEKREVSIYLMANGGTASFPKEWYPSVMLAPGYLFESGLANLDGVALREMLQAKDLGFNISVGGNFRSISIAGNPEYEELMFQLIRALFLEKRFRMDMWTNLVEKRIEVERNRNNSPYYVFSKKVKELVHSSHPFFTVLNANDAKEEIAREVLEKAFSNPEEFTMIVVGDFDEKRWRELAERYLSFAKVDGKLDPTVLPVGTFPKSGRDETMQLGKESHCFNVFTYQAPFALNEERKTSYSYDALEHILQGRLTERLRKEYGDTYSVSVSNYFPFTPCLDEIFLTIYFSCEPEKSEKLKSATLDVVATLMKDGPTEAEIQREREILHTNKKRALQSNSEWLSMLIDQVNYGTPIKVLSDEGLIDKEVTEKHVHDLAKSLFSGKPVKVTLLPEAR